MIRQQRLRCGDLATGAPAPPPSRPLSPPSPPGPGTRHRSTPLPSPPQRALLSAWSVASVCDDHGASDPGQVVGVVPAGGAGGPGAGRRVVADGGTGTGRCWPRSCSWPPLAALGGRLQRCSGCRGRRCTGGSPSGAGPAKIHSVTERTGPTLSIGISAANAHDSLGLEPWCAGSRRGPRRRRPAKLHADKGYDYENLRNGSAPATSCPASPAEASNPSSAPAESPGEVTVGRPSQRHFGGMLASWLSRSQSAGLDCGLCH